jgi:anti-sigma factor RsiW
MPHLDELQIQSYLDGELGSALAQQVHTHLDTCPACRAEMRGFERLGADIRAVSPTSDLFSPEGEFWARLARNLPQTRPATWPWLPYLPPVLLGVFGSALEMLLYVVSVVYILVGLRVLPSLGPVVSQQLAALVGHPALAISLYSWLGWSTEQAVQVVTQPWASLSVATQDSLIFVSVFLVVGALMALVVALYLVWVLCWSRPASLEQSRGN